MFSMTAASLLGVQPLGDAVVVGAGVGGQRRELVAAALGGQEPPRHARRRGRRWS